MAKKQIHEEHENLERWLVSYADFITLLFAFFTVLYATSQKDVAKAKEFEQSVKSAFHSFWDSGGVMGEFTNGETPVPIPIPLSPAGETTTEALGREIEDLAEQEEEEVQKKKKQATGGEGGEQASGSNGEKQDVTKQEEKNNNQQPAITEVRHDSMGVHISLAASALFPSGSDKFYEASGLKTLDKVAEILKKGSQRIIVEGHTDNINIATDKFPSNWDLSAARATRVTRYLIVRHSIKPERLVAVAYADQRPAAANDSEEGRQKNRRIELLIASDKWKP